MVSKDDREHGPHNGREYQPEPPVKSLEDAFQRVRDPFQVFLSNQTTSGLILFACTVVAMVVANTGYSGGYAHFFETGLGVRFGDWTLERSLHHWINDGLMPLFFFVLGLEMKREILAGELQDFRRCLLIGFIALGGMLVPALVFLGLNPESPGLRGWGIPMATDTAFALAALALLVRRVPGTLKTFLVAIAIVDDLGAVMVIALFYTSDVAAGYLGAGMALLALLVLFNLLGIRRAWPYALVGVLLWYAFLSSGVHTTVAGVLVALAIPARPRHGPTQFARRLRGLVNRFETVRKQDEPILGDQDGHEVVEDVRQTAEHATTPLQRWEQTLGTPVALLVLPIFALANAGVTLPAENPMDLLSENVTLGVMLALVLGKLSGLTGMCWLGVRLGLGRLPSGMNMAHVAGLGLLGGMGFTMSLFIAELAFATTPDVLAQAKAGILIGSAVAGAAGIAWLWWVGNGIERK